ncbi:hypothetical protein BJX99DRAFT_261887 [Aspergillus californicus]
MAIRSVGLSLAVDSATAFARSNRSWWTLGEFVINIDFMNHDQQLTKLHPGIYRLCTAAPLTRGGTVDVQTMYIQYATWLILITHPNDLRYACLFESTGQGSPPTELLPSLLEGWKHPGAPSTLAG